MFSCCPIGFWKSAEPKPDQVLATIYSKEAFEPYLHTTITMVGTVLKDNKWHKGRVLEGRVTCLNLDGDTRYYLCFGPFGNESGWDITPLVRNLNKGLSTIEILSIEK